MRIWPIFVLGRRFSGLVAIQPGHELVTDGIYGVIRHPSYLGLIVMTLGRRSLLEQGQAGATVTLQPVVLEYATDRLVDRLADEIGRGEPA